MRELSLRAPSLGLCRTPSAVTCGRRVQELVAADEQHVEPRRARVVGHALGLARRDRERARGGVADGDGLLEDRAHPLVGRERLALADPDGGELTEDLGIARAGRLLLDELVDRLPEREVVRRDRVDLQMHRVDERRLGLLGRTGERRPPGQEAPHRGAHRSRRVRVDPDAGLDRRDRRGGVVVDHERPPDQRRAGRADMGDVKAAVGQRPVIARAHQQVLAALAAIGSGQADVGDPPEPHVVDRPEDRARRRHHRNVDHHRPVREIDERPEVDRVRVRGQEQRRRIHQLGEDQELVVLDADAEEPASNQRPRTPPGCCSGTPRRRA